MIPDSILDAGGIAGEQRRQAHAAAAEAHALARREFRGRNGHGGTVQITERHLSRRQLELLLAEAFIRGARWAREQERAP